MFRLPHSIAAIAFAIVSTAALARPLLYQWIPTERVTLPAASVTMDKGAQRTLADFKGHVVVLNLWATWCAPCLEELPTLDALEQELHGEGLVVLAVSVDQRSSYDALRKRLSGEKLALPHMAYDAAGAYGALAIRGLPVTYLIDRKGMVRYQYHGGADWSETGPQLPIRALLAEGK